MRWLIVVGCALVLAVAGGGPSGSSVSLARESSSYTLLQMNLCLSGFARCYGKVAYPAGVDEAVARIRDAHPDAVTLNETCQGDVAQIARRTGYHLRFSTVTVSGEPLACVRPGGRGRFGDAVLTKAAIESSDSHDFKAQAGIEWRRWLCVTTRAGVDVCTAHLATRSPPRRPRTTRSAPSSPRSSIVARPPARSYSGATSTEAAPAPPSAPGPGPTVPPTRPRDSRASTGAARSARPRRRCCRPGTPTTTSCWSARASPEALSLSPSMRTADLPPEDLPPLTRSVAACLAAILEIETDEVPAPAGRPPRAVDRVARLARHARARARADRASRRSSPGPARGSRC